MKMNKSRISLANKTYTWKFSVLAMILYIVLFIYPSILSIYLSMTDWSVTKWDYEFVGLKHFQEIFTKSNHLKYIGRTCWFAFVTSIAKAIVGLALALALNSKYLKSKNVLRAIFFMPNIISPLIIGIIFQSIFHPTGIINGFLDAIGLGMLKHAWLTDVDLAFNTVMVVEVWRYAGFNMVVFLAGLQMIDTNYYEAAEIDGANAWQRFRHITVPCLMPSITINTVLNVMSGLKVFDLIFTMTKGGPGDITDVLNTVIFQEYSKGRYGFSTALGVVLFVITAVIAFAIYIPLSKKEIDGE